MLSFFKLRFHANYLGLCISLLLCSCGITLAQQTLTWPTSWKLGAPAKIIVAQKGGDGQPYIYHTKNFELRSLTPLDQRELQIFATTAESVPRVLKRLPMPLLGMPEGGRAKVLIYPDEDSFIAGGGVQGAAGYYNGRMKAILLRADTFLKPTFDRASRLPPKANYTLLVHEFTHLCMHRYLAYLPPWFVEGVAEYISAAHENKGVYQFSTPSSSIRKRIRQGLPNDKDEIILPGIAETMALTHKDWGDQIKNGQPENFYRSYATSLLIVHTLFHGGDQRREATRKFLQAQRLRPHYRSPGQSFLRPRWDKAETELIPLEERKKLQQRIIDYWRPRGLRLKFT